MKIMRTMIHSAIRLRGKVPLDTSDLQSRLGLLNISITTRDEILFTEYEQ